MWGGPLVYYIRTAARVYPWRALVGRAGPILQTRVRRGRGADLEAAINRGTHAARDGKPYLIDVVISCYGGGAESTWYEKFSVAEKRKLA